MFSKEVLSEQFVITHKVSDLLKVDKKNLIANAIRNHVLEKRLDDEDWYADYNYVKIDDHQHLAWIHDYMSCLLYTSPSPRDRQKSRMQSSA